MPEDHDWEAYKVPPTRTPVSERTTSVPNPVNYFQSAFSYVFDTPVTFVRGIGGTRPSPRPPPRELSSDAGTRTRGWAHRGAGQRREDTGTWTGKGHTQGHRDTGPGSNSTGRGTGHWDTGTRDIDKNTARTRGHGTQTNTRRGQRDRHRDMRHSMDTGTDTGTSGHGTQLGHWERCRGYRDTVTQRGPDMGHGTEGQTHSWA